MLAPDLIGFAGRTSRPGRWTILCAPRRLGDVVADRVGPAKRRHQSSCRTSSLIGLRVAAENPDRFEAVHRQRLSSHRRAAGPGGVHDLASVRQVHPGCSPAVARRPGTVHPVPRSVRAGYDAPFPTGGIRPGRGPSGLVPTSPDDRPSWPTGRWREVPGHWLRKGEHCLGGGVCLGWGGGFTSIVGVCSYLQSSGVR